MSYFCDPDIADCVQEPKDCDDDDKCTQGDYCDEDTGGCVNIPLICNDGNKCTDDSCNPDTGQCVYVDVDCNDDNVCTDDSCDTIQGCQNTPVAGAECTSESQCADGNLCTEDICDTADTCTCSNPDVDCDDDNCCTADSCEPAQGCHHELEYDGCQPCVEELDCLVECPDIDGEPIAPDDPDSGLCDPDTYVEYNAQGIAKIYRTECTTWYCKLEGEDVADCGEGAGKCSFLVKTCDDGDNCTLDYCVPANGECFHQDDPECCTFTSDPPLMEEDPNWDPEVSICLDDDPCTVDHCNYETGECYYDPVVCFDGNECTTDACITEQGGCVFAEIQNCHYTCYNDYDCRFDHGKWRGEACDDGNTESADGCSADCYSKEICGNNYVDVALNEQCDDGNAESGDGCDAQCQMEANPTCGDDVVQDGEACDDGNIVSGDGCRSDCRSTEKCGNGIVDVEVGEECDDGNLIPGDGCDNLCKVVPLLACGNFMVDPADEESLCSTEYCSHAADPYGTCIYETLVCDDGLPCTEDKDCIESAGCQFEGISCPDDEVPCVKPEGPEAPECDDGRKCTNDACSDEGVCVTIYLDCNDNEPCTFDWCDPYTGSCMHDDAPNCISDCNQLGGEEFCDDGNNCTVDTCVEDTGECDYTLGDCFDHDICTADSCDAQVGCVFTVIQDCQGCQTNADCDDGVACTVDACVEANPLSVDDPNYSGNGFQHPPKYCTYRSICVECETDDECDLAMAKNLCITAATCNAETGYCDLEWVDCNDDDDCTTDDCNLFTGDCINTQIAGCCEATSDCVDTNKCTGAFCKVADMECDFPYYLCDDYDPCTADSCDYFTGDCLHEDLTECYDECEKDIDCVYLPDPPAYCSVPVCEFDPTPPNPRMRCNEGTVGVTKECVDAFECTIMQDCMPQFGCIAFPVPDCFVECNADLDCFDADLCTTDYCDPDTGLCDNQPVNCIIEDECFMSWCDRGTGECQAYECPDCECDYPETDEDCDDNNICTDDAVFDDGEHPTFCDYMVRICNDGNPCTQDTCNPVTGCVFTPIEKCIGCMEHSECKDNNDCTVDQCGQDHVCQHDYICG